MAPMSGNLQHSLEREQEKRKPQKKKLILCCDGTGYAEITQPNKTLTNVSRIARCINKEDKDGNPQVVYYQPGVGTDSWSPGNLLKQAFGAGILENIMEAYSFICHNYTDGQDEIYLIGFSRGAFTVRCVAHLIHDEGILKKPYLSHLPEIFNKWRNRVVQSEVCNEPSSGTTMAEPEIQNLNEIGERAMVNISIKACAVWDTVSSVGTGMLFGKPKDLRLVHSDLCPRIEYAYQALSLYERRRPFLPMVWRLPKSPTSGPYARDIANFEQCWFHGYHGDIGGGNDIDMQALAHLPLAWMISKLDGLLSFDKESLWKPNPFPSGWTLRPSDEGVGFTAKAKVADTLSGIFWLGGARDRKPRCQFWDSERWDEIEPSPDIVSNETMHISVRLLMEIKALQPCKLLNGIEPDKRVSREGLDQSWFWQLRHNAKTAKTYEVNEGGISSVEFRLIRAWLDEVLISLSNEKKEGDDSPNTAIPEVLYWLCASFPYF